MNWKIKIPHLDFVKECSITYSKANKMYLSFFLHIHEAVGDHGRHGALIEMEDDGKYNLWIDEHIHFTGNGRQGCKAYKSKTHTITYEFIYNVKTKRLRPISRETTYFEGKCLKRLI